LVRGAADDVELFLYDEVGRFGIRAADFVRELKGLEAGVINLLINSPGGDVPDAVAIYNALREHSAQVVTHIDALAASAATLIALAGDEVRMAENAMFMIHDVWGITIGSAEEHRQTAELLDKVTDATLLPAYIEATGRKESTIRAWMKAETWFTAEEAKEARFVDTVVDPSDVRASFDPDRFRFQHAPAALTDSARDPTVRELERAVRQAGLSRTAAAAFVAEGKKALRSTALQRDAEGAGLLQSLQQLTATISPAGAASCPRNSRRPSRA
jgi:ATP-dependent Clp protease, protease subunit